MLNVKKRTFCQVSKNLQTLFQARIEVFEKGWHTYFSHTEENRQSVPTIQGSTCTCAPPSIRTRSVLNCTPLKQKKDFFVKFRRRLSFDRHSYTRVSQNSSFVPLPANFSNVRQKCPFKTVSSRIHLNVNQTGEGVTFRVFKNDIGHISFLIFQTFLVPQNHRTNFVIFLQ